MLAIICTQVVADHVEARFASSIANDASDTLLADKFGNLMTSGMSLYKAITGGIDWEELSDPLMDYISPWLGLLVVCYIGFSVLVVLNLVTGLFVDGALKLSREDKENEFMKKILKLFHDTDTELDSPMDLQDFIRHSEDPVMRDLFRSIDLSPDRSIDLFHFLDSDNSGILSVKDFAVGTLNLLGPVNGIDVALLGVQMKTTMSNLHESIARLKDLTRQTMSKRATQATS